MKNTKPVSYTHLDVYKRQDQGGCCDNDVHEIFKCVEEVILTRAYVHEEDGRRDAFNCTVDNMYLIPI